MRVVQTTLTETEHKLLEEYARKNSKTIKEILREAIRNTVEGCIDPHDPIFTQPPSAKQSGKQENIASEHDKYLYSESA
ncbi:MAG: hypothetical protein NWE93_06620 [Candidatus Bathyarchaeota archaeon]|nr:hypothetical protein [Candidatus Bathyarchaeota archaeon]